LGPSWLPCWYWIVRGTGGNGTVIRGGVTVWTRPLVAVLSVGWICWWMGCKLPEEGRSQRCLQSVWPEQPGGQGSETDDRFEKPSDVVIIVTA